MPTDVELSDFTPYRVIICFNLEKLYEDFHLGINDFVEFKGKLDKNHYSQFFGIYSEKYNQETEYLKIQFTYINPKVIYNHFSSDYQSEFEGKIYPSDMVTEEHYSDSNLGDFSLEINSSFIYEDMANYKRELELGIPIFLHFKSKRLIGVIPFAMLASFYFDLNKVSHKKDEDLSNRLERDLNELGWDDSIWKEETDFDKIPVILNEYLLIYHSAI